MLIVIVIIGTLAAALIPRLVGIQARARDTARMMDMRSINTALSLYQTDNGSYPIGSWYSLNTNEYITSTGRERKDILNTQLQPYLNSLPEDPEKNRAYVYGYVYNNTQLFYRLYADYEAKASDRWLIAYRDMKTISENKLRDMSGNGHDGNFIGWVIIGWVAWWRWWATYFDGLNDSIQTIDNIDLSMTDNITLSFWSKSTGSSLSVVMEHSSNFNANNAFLIDHSEYGVAGSYQLSDKNWWYNISYTNNSLNDNNRHNIVITIDRRLWKNQTSIFIDWVLWKITLHTSLFTDLVGNFSSHPLYIGSRNKSSYFYKGNLDEIRIFNRILSAREVKDYYNNSR